MGRVVLPCLNVPLDMPAAQTADCAPGKNQAVPEVATRILIHRLRVKFRTLLKDEVARTVLAPEEIAGELAWLQSVLAGK